MPWIPISLPFYFFHSFLSHDSLHSQLFFLSPFLLVIFYSGLLHPWFHGTVAFRASCIHGSFSFLMLPFSHSWHLLFIHDTFLSWLIVFMTSLIRDTFDSWHLPSYDIVLFIALFLSWSPFHSWYHFICGPYSVVTHFPSGHLFICGPYSVVAPFPSGYLFICVPYSVVTPFPSGHHTYLKYSSSCVFGCQCPPHFFVTGVEHLAPSAPIHSILHPLIRAFI